MGLLSRGKPLSWEETKKNAWIVHRDGVLQFLSLYHKLKDRKGDTLKWGDEIEYSLIICDDEKKKASLYVKNTTELLEILKQPSVDDPDNHDSKWAPEYSSYSLEGTPGSTPYGGCYGDFNLVEANMKLRRQQVYDVLKGTEVFPVSITSFPRVGCPGYTYPQYEPQPATSASRSLFFPDESVTSSHPRFLTLTRNIRERRGEKIQINIPVFKDTNTPSPFLEHLHVPNDDGTAAKYGKPDHVYMDAMGFGMGSNCLQVTFQACDIDEARLLYDQLSNICPVLVSLNVADLYPSPFIGRFLKTALSAATVGYRGYLVDHDCRLEVISAGVDCRTREERGLEPLKNDKFVIPKSRYDTISMYLSGDKYNDVDIPYNPETYKTLRDNGIDHILAKHVAHLFIRDPVSLFEEKLHLDNENDSDHFENIQSTNWQSMRFKPPPPNSKIGWRVEFRPLDLQITDFENAAFVVFIVLLTRAILSFKLNFLIPISKMEENMRRAIKRDAVHSEMFYFRKSLVPEGDEDEELLVEKKDETSGATATASPQSIENEYTLMSVNTIINGKDEFPGIIPLVRMYVNSIDIDVDTRCTIMQYLSLISKRASGELLTNATWFRRFIDQHPDYKHDSYIPESITYDLMRKIKEIEEGTTPCPELIGKMKSMASLKKVPCPEPSVKKPVEN